MTKKILKIILGIIVFIIVLILVIFISNKLKIPSLDRDWSEDSKILPSISINENIIEIKNIRDWRYDSEKVLSKDYYDETFNLDEVEKTYLLFNPFGKWDGVGHSFFLFEFSDGKVISVSIEARREKDEEFNSIKGLFNKYELWYAYGSAADFITRRAVHYEDHELNMYPLLISKEASRNLFLDLAQQAQELETKAKFYNTLTSNCTNLLMDSANRTKKGSVPFHYSRLFTGYADDYMHKLGFIPNDQSFEEINKKFRIDLQVQEIDNEFKTYSREEFWHELLKKINKTEIYENRPIEYLSQGYVYSDAISFDRKKRFFTTYDAFEFKDYSEMPQVVNFNLYSSDVDGENIQHIKKLSENSPYLELLGANYDKGELYFKSTFNGWDFRKFVITDLSGNEIKIFNIETDSMSVEFKNNNTAVVLKTEHNPNEIIFEINLLDYSYTTKGILAHVSMLEDLEFDSYGVVKASNEISRYENKDWGIQFEYPSNYIVKEIPERDYVKVDYPEWTAARDGLGGVSITLTEMTYEEFREAVNQPEEYSKIIEEKEFIIDGKKANLLIHSTAVGLDRSVIFVEHKGNNFYIDYPDHPVQREIFNSIKFI